MSTSHLADVLAERKAQLTQKCSEPELIAKVPAYEILKIQDIVIKPQPSSWEELEKKLQKVINFDGVWFRAKELYDKGFGAELETLAEITLKIHRGKYPYQLFAASISKQRGNWETITLKMVNDTWEARQNTLTVMDKLNLKEDSTRAILAIAWRLKSAILRFLALATEKEVGIKNPIGYFFALTKKPKDQPAVA